MRRSDQSYSYQALIVLVFTAVLATAAFLSAVASAQVTYSVTSQTVIDGVTEADLDGSVLVVPPGVSLKPISTSLISLEGAEGFSFAVMAEDARGGAVKVIETEAGGYRVFSTGRLKSSSFGTDFDARKQTLLRIEINPDPGPDPPGPDPGPDPPGPEPNPDVPEDDFDNIGRRVNQWADGLLERDAYAKAFRTAADCLRNNPSGTVDSCNTKLSEAIKAASSFAQYSAAVGSNLSEDLDDRWPLPRGVLADYYDAVAAGMGVGQ